MKKFYYIENGVERSIFAESEEELKSKYPKFIKKPYKEEAGFFENTKNKEMIRLYKKAVLEILSDIENKFTLASIKKAVIKAKGEKLDTLESIIEFVNKELKK